MAKSAKTAKPSNVTKISKPAEKSAGALERTLSQIEKQFGEGAIMHLDESGVSHVAGISTGALSLDLALLPKHKKPVVSRLLSMPNTPSTPPGPSASASTSKRCWSLNLTPANRP